MIPILAYRLQEQAFGSMSAASRGRLRQLARAFEANPNSSASAFPASNRGRAWFANGAIKFTS